MYVCMYILNINMNRIDYIYYILCLAVLEYILYSITV